MSIGPRLWGDVRPRKVGILTAQAIAQYDLTGLSSGNAVRAQDQSWASAVATPTAPTVADTGASIGAGGPLTNSVTGVKISYQFPWGEGTLSAAGTATPTAHAGLLISGAPLTPPTPALWTNIYIESSAGSGTYLKWGQTLGESRIANVYGNGPAPYAGNAGNVAVNSGATELTQYNFALTFCGLSHQRKDATTQVRPYGSSEDNKLIVHAGGVFPMDCASASFNVGDAVGPAKDTGNALLSQKVVGVVDISLGIGYVAEAGSTVTSVKVEIIPYLERLGAAR